MPRTRSRNAGYTLIELVIVMTIILVLLSVALPSYTKAVKRSKETQLHENLFTLRNMIHQYSFEHREAPQVLEDLVEEGYIMTLPFDPMTGSNQTWKTVREDDWAVMNRQRPGIGNVYSGSEEISLEGTRYDEW